MLITKCIEVVIPSINERFKFEGVSESNLLKIIENVVRDSSSNNVINLQLLSDALNNMEDITSIISKDQNFSEIGDKVVGNTSISELGRILFRFNVEGSNSLIPMFSLLSSMGFKTSSSNIILTKDPNVENKIYLGNRQFKIVLNPTKPNFLQHLYKSLGFGYINVKLQNQSSIANGIQSYLDKLSNIETENEEFNKHIKDIQSLSFNQRLRAFLTYVLNDSNVPNSVQYIINELSIAIETDIEGHLQEHIKQIREQVEYGKSKYNDDLQAIKTSKLALKRELEQLQANDGSKQQIENIQNQIDDFSEVETRIAIYNRMSSYFNNNWNPYTLSSGYGGIIEGNIKKDLRLEKIIPRTIKFAENTLSTKDLTDFLNGLRNKRKNVFTAPSEQDLINILTESGINPVDGTLSKYSRAQRVFLSENQDFFKLFWNPINHTTVDPETFNVEKIIQDLILEDTIYLPYDDYQSDYTFDLRGLTILSDTDSFIGSSISQYSEKGLTKAANTALKIKFTSQKDATLKIETSRGRQTLIIPINQKIDTLPKSIEDYLKSNTVRSLYVEFESNSNIKPELASKYFEDTIRLLNNVPNTPTINTLLVKGLNAIQIELSKIASDLGLSVKVFTDNKFAFDVQFEGYQTKSWSSNVRYKFPKTNKLNNFKSSSLERALINKEISGLLYDTTTNELGDTRILSKLAIGSQLSLQTESGNKIESIVKNIIKFNPMQLLMDSTNSGGIEIGSLVRKKNLKSRNLYYVVDISENGKYLLSDGHKNVGEYSKSNLEFYKQSPIIINDGRTVFLKGNDASKVIEAKTGNIMDISPEVFNTLYDSQFIEISKITGLGEDYIRNIINNTNSSNFGVIDLKLQEDSDINSNPESPISKLDVEYIVQSFADKLNKIFKHDFVNIVDPDTMETLSSYEYQHPAFIKDSKIYINISHPGLHAGSLVHELSHLILASIRSVNPEVYYDLLSKVDLESGKYDNLKIRYENRLRSDVKEEVLADLFGKHFDRQILDYGSLEEAFNNLTLKQVFKDLFDISGQIPSYITNNQLMNMTINDAVTKTSSNYGNLTSIFNNPKAYKVRQLSNLKEQLYKENKIEEICQ